MDQIPVAARSKAYLCGLSLASNPAGGMGVYLSWMLCVVQIDASATGLSFIQRSPTECGVSERDQV